MDRGFTRRERLLKRGDYVRLFTRGRKYHTASFMLFHAGNTLSHARLGITVSGKVAAAVRRNRIKRLVREFFRLSKHLFLPGYDYSIVAKRHCRPESTAVVAAELTPLLERLGRDRDPWSKGSNKA
ncbi:MAG: ribonuclease P protein component [Deltaproteobacteria bacterium]|nr:ribonuclease P protein component [Candidatus Anaeroferrophillacea bacterium]